MTSEAEEALRAKAVAAMRVRFPGGRVLHELPLEQYGVRIDLACVTPDRICVAELKSERDTLKRLDRQVRVSIGVADEVWVCVAEKHRAAVTEAWQRYPIRRDFDDDVDHAEAVALFEAVNRTKLFIETDQGLQLQFSGRAHEDNLVSSRRRFELLWHTEMCDALARHFGSVPSARVRRPTRHSLMLHAVEHMTGREIRRAVCVQLRHRAMPRADEPVAMPEWGLARGSV